ncbi:hypothetical protein Scep_010213 [Stephania cephalantha]|uniref:Uncharacterized protein n=1 Tax=Stephania cephalantha TaxID=152367 RepID=A0AAP0JUP1_9MAGN
MEEPIDLRLTYDRERAMDSALASTSIEPNFLSIMQPSHVHQRFFSELDG